MANSVYISHPAWVSLKQNCEDGQGVSITHPPSPIHQNNLPKEWRQILFPGICLAPFTLLSTLSSWPTFWGWLTPDTTLYLRHLPAKPSFTIQFWPINESVLSGVSGKHCLRNKKGHVQQTHPISPFLQESKLSSKEFLGPCWRECKSVQPQWNTGWRFLSRLQLMNMKYLPQRLVP